MDTRFNNILRRSNNLEKDTLRDYIKRDMDDNIIPLEATDENINKVMDLVSLEGELRLDNNSIASQIHGAREMYTPYELGEEPNNHLLSRVMYEIARTSLYYSGYKYSYESVDELYNRISRDISIHGSNMYTYIHDNYITDMAKEGLVSPIVIEVECDGECNHN